MTRGKHRDFPPHHEERYCDVCDEFLGVFYQDSGRRKRCTRHKRESVRGHACDACGFVEKRVVDHHRCSNCDAFFSPSHPGAVHRRAEAAAELAWAVDVAVNGGEA